MACLTAHLFTPNNKLTGQYERKSRETNKQPRRTKKPKQPQRNDICEEKNSMTYRLTVLFISCKDIVYTTSSAGWIWRNSQPLNRLLNQNVVLYTWTTTWSPTHLLSVSRPTKSFFSKGTQSKGILSPDLSVARSSRLLSSTMKMDSTKSSTRFSTSEHWSNAG